MNTQFRIGLGYDVHRLAEGETLVLGGVTVAEDIGTVAHSDGDVLLHAICDALLGAAALGDIGEHFPDTDPAYRGVSSLELLRHCVMLLDERGFGVVNIDATLILEKPKILPFKREMRSRIAEAASLDIDGVSLKATTAERMGFVGRGEGVEAHAAALIARKD
ncbi:MAG: 2-C-methyl-D-erythritol 2,4-cyclodiphosphate synthase [Bacteroidetes bacterium]|nr:2-C-methyl-D-erythritol 2,4-cyclodiphosphate synthase [Bacteroidota bacterium]